MTDNSQALALLVGGGPAPGINGVISAATIEARNRGVRVLGVLDGFQHLAELDTSKVAPLEIRDVSRIHFRGGSILRTSRSNPTKDARKLDNVVASLRELGVRWLVTIGGDDTAFSASRVAAQAGGGLSVVHVPKTIDNDLPLPGGIVTFGFETARHVGVSLVETIMEDARATSRWYLLVAMGRKAGHLALGIGKAAAATLTIIPEEFRGRQVTIAELCDLIVGAIVKRASQKRYYGVVVLAEGLIEAIGETALTAAMDSGQLGRYGQLSRDPHGHLRLGEIEFGRMMRDLLAGGLEQIGLKTTLIDKDLGYELRCADPIPFDAEYTRDLGYGAVKFLRSEAATRIGAVISYVEGRMDPLPFDQLLNPQTKRMKNRKVDVSGEGYECARRYMIRLDRTDFEDPERLHRLAAAAGMSPDQFRQRFEYVVAHDA